MKKKRTSKAFFEGRLCPQWADYFSFSRRDSRDQHKRAEERLPGTQTRRRHGSEDRLGVHRRCRVSKSQHRFRITPNNLQEAPSGQEVRASSFWLFSACFASTHTPEIAGIIDRTIEGANGCERGNNDFITRRNSLYICSSTSST